MIDVACPPAPVSPSSPSCAQTPSLDAAALLVASEIGRPLGLSMPSPAEILRATGVARSTAYEQRLRVRDGLESMVPKRGRPSATPTSPSDQPLQYELRGQVLRFLMANPGCIHDGPQRRAYDQSFIDLILGLREAHPQLLLRDLADASLVPLGTLEDWLRPGRDARAAPDLGVERPVSEDAMSGRIQTILDAYRRWKGSFMTFCAHVRDHLHIDYGPKLISSILFAHGVRTPRRRGRRHSDEAATRGSFATFFPGAQWVGDGMQVPVVINGHRFLFNLELDVDAYSGACVGASVRNEEDSTAVVNAFTDGVSTTKEPPLAFLLDNREANHTAEVHDAIKDTILISATPGRGQNKAHVEGAFGLFAQLAPDLELEAASLRDLARDILRLQVQTFLRLLNHRPRADRGGKTRVELYREAQPSEEQVAAAKKHFRALLRKQEQARRTRAARADPVVRQLLDEAFQRLGIQDPRGDARDAIAAYSRNDVVDGIATLEGKREAGTIPKDAVLARYLLGIVRNIAHGHEADPTTRYLIDLRLHAHDLALAELDREHRAFLDRHPTQGPSLVAALARHAMDAYRGLDRTFWIERTADAIRTQPVDAWREIATAACNRFHTAFRAPPHERQAAERLLLRILWPLE